MTNEEIRKLLGGYATNTLTEAERKVLFEAALDDQELFNAMQAEESLKDLLSDPFSREQVRQTLETPVAVKPGRAWWSQWWAWGSAVVAAILIVAVIRSNPSQPKLREVASVIATKPADQLQPMPLAKEAATTPKQEPAGAKTFRRARAAVGPEQRKDEADLAKTPPPPPPVPAVQERESAPPRSSTQAETPRSVDAGHSQNSQVPQNASTNARDSISNQAGTRQEQFQPPPVANALRDSDRRVATTEQFRLGAVAGFATGPLRFSLMKRDSKGDFVSSPDLKKGDAVQLRVIPALSGYISLSQLDQSGTWRRVFPSSGPGISVVANSAYSLPDAPIEVTDKDETFRVTLSLPTPETKASTAETVVVEKEKSSLKRARIAVPPKAAPQPSPLFVDLTIGPKNQ
jgi:hypothetical protein